MITRIPQMLYKVDRILPRNQTRINARQAIAGHVKESLSLYFLKSDIVLKCTYGEFDKFNGNMKMPPCPW